MEMDSKYDVLVVKVERNDLAMEDMSILIFDEVHKFLASYETYLVNISSRVKSIQKLNEHELSSGIDEKGSWHDQYKNSSYIFIGGLPFELNEGDISTIFSQYGEISEVHLVRDKESGKSRGFAFLGYADQRSTILAVDNFNGIKVLNRVLRVDHTDRYKSLKEQEEEAARKKAKSESKISEMADEIFKNAVGSIFSKPADYDEKAVLLSPQSLYGVGEERDEPASVAEDERQARRRRKEERRARETSAERYARKSKSAKR